MQTIPLDIVRSLVTRLRPKGPGCFKYGNHHLGTPAEKRLQESFALTFKGFFITWIFYQYFSSIERNQFRLFCVESILVLAKKMGDKAVLAF